MKILTSGEMGAADRRTSEEFGVTLQTLMEGAGAAVALFCCGQYPGARRVLVICGKGNNGGDGLVAAGMCEAAGAAVRVLVRLARGVRGEAARALEQLRREVPGVEIRNCGR